MLRSPLTELPMATPDRVVCTRCAHHGPVKLEVPGHFLLEVFLWLLWILPGLFYSIWRVSNKRRVCSVCGSTGIIPEASSAARDIAGRDEVDCPSCAERILRNAKVCKHCGRDVDQGARAAC